MKRTLLTLFCTLLALAASADEGMWLPSLISQRIDDMRAKGFRLTAEDIYSINKASMKDAVVLFNGGCTGELISSEGLLLTNHHCGYDAIQAHSSVEHDYLTNGFWAMSRREELPNKELNVRFLVRMEEVTDRIAAGETKAEIIRRAEAEGKGYKASVEQMYYGNQQFLFIYEQFDDVRLVGAPPSSIGKFGGDTDNWAWPRHTGDFSMFRIYADKDNRPSYGDDIKPQVKALNRDIFRVLYREYYDNCTQEYMVPLFAAEVERLGSPEAYAELMFEATHKEDESTEAPELEALRADIRTTVTRIFDELGKCSTRNLNSERLNELYTTYIKGLREWDTERAFYPDANLTLRVAYGKVGGYRYADGVYHKPYTTVEGILEKDNPEIYDYNIPQRLRDIIAAKDYGRWGVEIDGRTTVPVCFLADNHTTGGNSGSPVLNGRGELIGVNFDRTWLSTMSDIAFDPAFCRNIALDIRYVLFVIDRIGDASYLFEEMDFAE